jgi:hypothetical protein
MPSDSDDPGVIESWVVAETKLGGQTLESKLGASEIESFAFSADTILGPLRSFGKRAADFIVRCALCHESDPLIVA